MLCQPYRQVDVEIVATITGVARGGPGQRATHAVKNQDQHFQHDYAHQPRRRGEAIKITEDRNCHDTQSEDRPDDGMKELDRAERGLAVHVDRGRAVPAGFGRDLAAETLRRSRRQTERAIISTSFVRMTRTVTGAPREEITAAFRALPF